MKHYVITIRVAYDDAYPIPESMEEQLHANVQQCVENENLLNDVDLEAVVETYDVRVECVG